MRLTFGSLTRRLPRAVAHDADVMVVKTCYCGTQPDVFYVRVAKVAWPFNDEAAKLSRGFRSRREAMATAWSICARTGGRLLDYQRGTLAEQALCWTVTLDRDGLDPALLGRRALGERHLIDLCAAWAGLPVADARTLARSLIAHGHARVALTQSESRMALRTRSPDASRARKLDLADLWRRFSAHPAERLPACVTHPPTTSQEPSHAR